MHGLAFILCYYYYTLDGLSAGDIGNNDLGNGGGGTVLVQVPLTAATRERSITNLDEKARLEDDEPASGMQSYMYM